MNDQIFFYSKLFTGKNRPVRKIAFKVVFNEWVEYNGGRFEFLKEINNLSSLQLMGVHNLFLGFFQNKYNAELPDDDDVNFQEFLWDYEYYIMHINQLAQEYQDRPFSIGNILFLVFVALAILGLVSLCS